MKVFEINLEFDDLEVHTHEDTSPEQVEKVIQDKAGQMAEAYGGKVEFYPVESRYIVYDDTNKKIAEYMLVF